jgi:hypothetical protein
MLCFLAFLDPFELKFTSFRGELFANHSRVIKEILETENNNILFVELNQETLKHVDKIGALGLSSLPLFSSSFFIYFLFLSS